MAGGGGACAWKPRERPSGRKGCTLVRDAHLNDHRKILSGAAFGIAGGLLGRAVGLVGTLLIARHLTPDIVAEVTVATVVALTGNWVAAWGCGQYVVVRGDEGKEAIFAATVVYLLAGVAMIAVLCWAAPVLALWLQAPRIADYLPGALLGIGIRRLGAIPDKLLARELRFGRIALGTALGDIAYAVVAVALVSTTTLGGQAMIIAFIVQSCVIAGVTITAVAWRDWLQPVRITGARLRDILRFGAPVTGEIVLSEGARYWDKPLMLRLLGAHDAGSYGMAFNLAQLPAVYVGGHVGTVMVPAVVRAAPEDRPELMVRALVFTALFLFPMAAGLSVCAQTLVATLLPATWAQVAPLLSVLAIASLPAAGSFILSSFLAAHARNHRLMWIEVATMFSLVAALCVLSKAGVVAASAAVGVATLLQWGLTVHACRADGLRLHGLLRPLACLALACGVMVLAVLAWRHALDDRLPRALRLPGEVGIGAIVYGGVVWMGARDLVVDAFTAMGLSRFLPGRRGRQGGDA